MIGVHGNMNRPDMDGIKIRYQKARIAHWDRVSSKIWWRAFHIESAKSTSKPERAKEMRFGWALRPRKVIS